MHRICVWKFLTFAFSAVHTIHKKETVSTHIPPVALLGTGIKLGGYAWYKPRCPANADCRSYECGGFVANVRIRTVAVFAN